MRARTTWLALASAGVELGLATTSTRPYQSSQDQVRLTQDALGHERGDSFPDIPPLEGMVHRSLTLSGSTSNRVNLVFFGDGYTSDEEEIFFRDAQRLTQDIIQTNASYGSVSSLLNVHAVFVPSKETGMGTHGKPRDTVFGLYRPGSELRAVFYQRKHRVMEACKYLRMIGKGCDEPILLGNDPLYGGLGGTPTVITASRVNGPLVLRHELGHTLIPAGEEYDGGYAYFGPNSAPLSALRDGISWQHWLTEPNEKLRLEDSKVPLQAYPWQDLVEQPYRIRFNASTGVYPTALLRLSVAGIRYENHLDVSLNGAPIAFTIPPQSRGGHDRAWIQVPLDYGIEAFGNRSREFELLVRLTQKGWSAPATQGGKMLTSVELIEYGPQTSFNKSRGYIGAFPTFGEHGDITLRPTDESCLMRDVTYPSFCPVCLESLYLALLVRVDLIEGVAVSCNETGDEASLEARLIDLADAETVYTWTNAGKPVANPQNSPSIRVSEFGWYTLDVAVQVPEVRKQDSRLRSSRTVWFGGCDIKK